MCRPVTCKTCTKTTCEELMQRERLLARHDAGACCGQHVAQVKAMVPSDQWCPGHPKAERQGDSWLGKLLGR